MKSQSVSQWVGALLERCVRVCVCERFWCRILDPVIGCVRLKSEVLLEQLMMMRYRDGYGVSGHRCFWGEKKSLLVCMVMVEGESSFSVIVLSLSLLESPFCEIWQKKKSRSVGRSVCLSVGQSVGRSFQSSVLLAWLVLSESCGSWLVL